MYNLPSSTEVKKQLPKKAIYAKFDMKPAQRERFDADIARLDIVAMLSPRTISALAEGEEVKEIYVLAVQLKRKDYDAKNIALLSKLIPHKMVFALQYEGEVQFVVHHTKLITSAWQIINHESAIINLQGLNLDIVWENIVKDIGDIKVEEGNTLTTQIKVNEEQTKLLAQIKTVGAYATGYNAHSIGICYEGGLNARDRPEDTRTPEQKVTLQRLLERLMEDYPEARIVGHRDLPGVKKDCPCFDVTYKYC